MDKQRTIVEFKSEIASLKSVTPWEEVKNDTIYHIPPIITLERRDIRIIKKCGDSATYCRVGDKEQTERKMFKTSVFAKFLVKKKKY